MQCHVLKPFALSKAQHGIHVIGISMHRPTRKKSDNMKSAATRTHMSRRIYKRRIFKKGAVLYGNNYPWQMVVKHSPRADCKMPHLGVPLLAPRQPHSQPRR